MLGLKADLCGARLCLKGFDQVPGRYDADGKIIEDWDAIQEVPIETRNGNPVY